MHSHTQESSYVFFKILEDLIFLSFNFKTTGIHGDMIHTISDITWHNNCYS